MPRRATAGHLYSGSAQRSVLAPPGGAEDAGVKRFLLLLYQAGDRVLDPQLLSFQVGEALLVGPGSGNLLADFGLELGVLGAQRVDMILQGHDRILSKGSLRLKDGIAPST